MTLWFVLATGSTSASDQILVVIINDDEPEVDELFEVQLVSVAESSQMIDSEHVSRHYVRNFIQASTNLCCLPIPFLLRTHL